MGMWGLDPWDNDAAADWFGDLMDTTQLRRHWLSAIEGDAEDDPERVRAAVWLFLQLGRVYVWPIDHLESDLELAIRAAERLKSNEELLEVDGIGSKFEREYRELVAQRRPEPTA
ncbi:MAG: hypothetical protein AAF219_00885 [Myxococcota bacterium]